MKEEAERHGLTVSALISQLIRQYVLVTRFAERTPAITLSLKVFDSLLGSVADDDLIALAEKTGQTVPEEEILQRGKPRNYDTVAWLLEVVYGKYNNWFCCSHTKINGKDRLHLSHQLNQKWSIFVGSYVHGIFKSNLDLDPKIERRPNSVTIDLIDVASPKILFSTSRY